MTATTLAIDVGHVHDRAVAGTERRRRRRAGGRGGAWSSTTTTTARQRSGGAERDQRRRGEHGRSASGIVVLPADVTFPDGPDRANNRVQVPCVARPSGTTRCRRSSARSSASTRSTSWRDATAEASPANAATCVKPFTIPDKWRRASDGAAGIRIDKFDLFDRQRQRAGQPRRLHPAGTATARPATRPTTIGARSARAEGRQPATRSRRASTTRGRCRAAPVPTTTAKTSPTATPNIVTIGDPMRPGAGQHGRPDRPGHRGSDRPGPERVLGHRLQLRQGQQFRQEPADCPIPAVRPRSTTRTASRTAATPDFESRTTSGSSSNGMHGNEVIGRITPIRRREGGAGPSPTGAVRAGHSTG